MRIIYAANIRMPSERAHGIQVAKTCEALAAAGADIELVVPKRKNNISQSAKQYYALQRDFKITYVPVLDWVSWGRLGFFIESLSFAFAFNALRFVKKDVAVYSRDELPLAILRLCGHRNIVWESHTGAWNIAARYAAKKAKAIVVISQGLKDFYIAKGISATKITVAHDGVDMKAFASVETKEEARTRLGLPLDEKIAIYIGGLGGWKGAEVLMQASEIVSNAHIAIIGGTQQEVESAKLKYPKVIFLGERPYAEISNNQAAADVLVLPNTARSTVSARYTSPLKLFTYMASHKPIVASDLPSIREVLDDTSAYFVPPDDPHALARGIEEAFKPEAHVRAQRAYELIHEYDWSKRAQKILAIL